MNFKKTFKHFTDFSWKPMGQVIGSAGDAEKTFTRGVLRASSCQVSPRWQGHQVKCTRLFWCLAPGFCWLCSSCWGILQTCLMGCQLSALPASPMFIPHANWCKLQQKLQRQSIHRAQYKNTSQELLMILKHPSFWKASLSLHSIEQNIKHSALGSVMSEANTDVNTVLHLCTSPDSSYFGFLICSSNQFSMNPCCLWEKCTCNKLGSHLSRGIISRVYNSFWTISDWNEQSQFILPFLFSKCKQRTV